MDHAPDCVILERLLNYNHKDAGGEIKAFVCTTHDADICMTTGNGKAAFSISIVYFKHPKAFSEQSKPEIVIISY